MPPIITKTDFLAWLRCPKLAWHRFNAPQKLAPPDAAAQALMRQGYEVDRLAWKLFPDGQVVGGTGDAVRDIQRTDEALTARRPLYEATFGAGLAFVRADVLVPAGRKAWDLFETKSTTKVEELHLQDVAFQAHVLRVASLPLRQCHLTHLNRDYIRRGAIDPKKLLAIEDVTEQIKALSVEVEAALPQMDRLRQQRRAPEVAVGAHCESPHRCPLYGVCWKRMPASSVFTLYRGGQRAAAFYKSGITRIDRLPTDARLTSRQKIQRDAVVSRQPHLDMLAVRRFLDRLEYPLALLDFETYAEAVPRFDRLRPYQQVPFQFSCHVVAAPGAKPEARGHLIRQALDPRRQFMEELRRLLPPRGSIVVYNGAFEQGRLAECGEYLPEFKPWIGTLKPRFVDLLEPFREFHYYHPAQHGSASIKTVLPALTGKSYKTLAIQDGATAALRYMEVTFGQATKFQREKVWADLEEYCGQDTLAMLWIIEALERLLAVRCG